MSELKTPPHSAKAERAAIGCVLVEPDLWYHLSAHIDEQCFYRPDHRSIWRAMAQLVEDKVPVDIISVAEKLDSQNRLDDIGGLQFLSSITDLVPTTTNALSYAEIVRSSADQRARIQKAQAYLQACWDGNDSEMLPTLMGSVTGSETIVPVRDAVVDTVTHLDRIFQGEIDPAFPSGIAPFDKKYGGLHPGNLIVFAGRPGMGKTALMMRLMQSGQRVFTASLEMTIRELVGRSLSQVGMIEAERIRNPKLMTNEDWSAIGSASEKLSAMPLHFYEGSSPHLSEIIRVIMRAKYQYGADIVMIDYLQLIEAEGGNRNESIGSVTRKLKTLAKTLGICIVIMAQVNRDVEKRQDKRPLASDLRDSGEIEQDADMIITLYRDAYYNENSADNMLELNIVKARHGVSPAFIRLGWDPKFVLVSDDVKRAEVNA